MREGSFPPRPIVEIEQPDCGVPDRAFAGLHPERWPDGNGGPSPDFRVGKIRTPSSKEFPNLEVDGEFITNHLHVQDGERLVIAHHTNRFRVAYARSIEYIGHHLGLIDGHLRHLQKEIDGSMRRLAGTNESVTSPSGISGRTPWIASDKATAVALMVVSALLLLIGINTLATYLIGSGYIVFAESPALAYILSAVNLGVAFLLKVGYSSCVDDRSRRWYFRAVWLSGLFCGGIWIVSFATLFPNIRTEGIGEIVAGLSAKRAAFSNSLETIFVGSQLVAEVCIAAALWIHLERMCRSHGPQCVVERNPEHKAQARRLSELNEQLRLSLEKRAELAGARNEIEALERDYLLRANSELAAKRSAYLEKSFRIEP